MLRRQRDWGVAAGIPPAEPGVLDQPRGAHLDETVTCRPRRGTVRCLHHDRVREERTGAPGVVVGLVQQHPLAPAEGEDGGWHVDQRSASPDRDVQRRGQLGVADGFTERAETQLERDVQHDVPIGALEAARAIAEAAVGAHERAHRTFTPVVGADAGDRGGHLLAVGPHVLHRRGTCRAGDAGEALDPGPPGGHGMGDDVVPRLPGRHGDHHATAGVGGERLDAACADPDHDTVEPLVRDEKVAPACEQKHGLAGCVGRAHPIDQLGFRRRGHQVSGSTADAQRGEVSERDHARVRSPCPAPADRGRSPSPRRSPRRRRRAHRPHR